jgi:hypothetical protein
MGAMMAWDNDEDGKEFLKEVGKEIVLPVIIFVILVLGFLDLFEYFHTKPVIGTTKFTGLETVTK